jgi:hypothetical protein
MIPDRISCRANARMIELQVPYYDRVQSLEADPERTRKETKAYRANVDQWGTPMANHGRDVDKTGYNCKQLFQDARFKLGVYLRVSAEVCTK